MILTEFAALVRRMRRRQCDYFRDRSAAALADCKVLEQQADRALDEIERQPGLFDPELAESGATPAARGEAVLRPTVVCLCGSTRFKQAFIEANFRETMCGRVVLSVGWFSHADAHVYAPTAAEKAALDELHLRKIDLADEVLVLNAGGYVGESTRREVEYARARGRRIRWLEPPEGGGT